MKAWLAHQAQRRPEATALIHGKQRLAWAELAEHAAQHAAMLYALGVQPGDRVFLQAPPKLRSAIWMHAILWLGAVVVPIDPDLTSARTRKRVERLRPAAMITTDPGALQRDSAVKSCPIIDAGTLPDPRLAPVDAAPYTPARLATIMFTSGSTGEPRSVPLTLENHRASTLSIARRIGMSDSDQWLLCLPLNHIGGLALLIRGAITGSAVAIQSGFDAASVLHALANGPHTLTSMVPTMLQRLLDHQTAPVSTDLRVLLIGGAPAAPALLQRARDLGWPVLPTWGMTEAGSQLVTMSPREAEEVDFEASPGIAGRPLDRVEVRIGPNGTLEVRGPMLFSGYLDAGGGPNAEGWFSTGDTGEFLADGNLRITGRVDDVIISGGVNVNLETVRRCLAKCSRVRDVFVVALADPCWGQRIGAVVQPRDLQADRETLRSFLVDWSRQRLLPAERPLKWRIVDNIPSNAADKPLKFACAALFEKD
mgnify:CR=1 FL=1